MRRFKRFPEGNRRSGGRRWGSVLLDAVFILILIGGVPADFCSSKFFDFRVHYQIFFPGGGVNLGAFVQRNLNLSEGR